ncbi:MAG: molybdenum cofactor guanylyltransferase, partial [Microthrixaceae bacterium]|nr:molybdenum cofactor guanylyltransferase [Microthrixaceae bacterium]
DGVAILDRVVAAATEIVDEVIILGRSHGSVRSVSEPEPRLGPLNAIAFGMQACPSDLVAVIAGDHPWIQPGLLSLLIARIGQHDAVVPIDRTGRAQPLVAVYHSRMAQQMSDAVSQGERSISRFVESIDANWVTPEEWEQADPGGLSFLDIDTHDDIERHTRGSHLRTDDTTS